MSSVRIPVSLCKEIEKLAHNFIWGSIDGSRKVSLLSWDDCCKPLKNGRLGLRQLADQNKLFLLKLGYHLLSNTDSLWIQVLGRKYNV